MNHQLLTWVAVCQKRTNRQQNLWNSQSRAPVVFQDIQTDDSLTVDVAVINSGAESNLKSQYKAQRESLRAAQGWCPMVLSSLWGSQFCRASAEAAPLCSASKPQLLNSRVILFCSHGWLWETYHDEIRGINCFSHKPSAWYPQKSAPTL